MYDASHNIKQKILYTDRIRHKYLISTLMTYLARLEYLYCEFGY